MTYARFKGKKRYIFLFILGLMVAIYPTFSNIYYNYITMRSQGMETNPVVRVPPGSTEAERTGRRSIVSKISEKEFKQIELDPEMKPLLSKDLSYLKEYNKKLWTISGYTADPFGETDGRSVESEIMKYADSASIFAYIKIPKINQTLPVYLGATDDHLNKGVAVIQGTSIPVGGENTNSIIAGHTGRVQKFFTDLPELEPGDEIAITNRWEIIYYKVTGNKLIWPDQVEYLAVITGKDMITLLTCYHGTSQNDRLLVFAERYYTEEKTEEKSSANLYPYLSEVELEVKPWYKKPQIFVIGVAVILFCLFMYTFFNKKKD